MSRFAAAALALALSACAGRLQHESVKKHYVVVVQEEDPLAPPEERAAALVTRPVAGGPLVTSGDHDRRVAFAERDPRFDVSIAWRGDCLDVNVARHGLPPFDDFIAHGCVKPDGGTTPVASVKGANGAPIDVLVWFFDGA
jgi:hypothetical protein